MLVSDLHRDIPRVEFSSSLDQCPHSWWHYPSTLLNSSTRNEEPYKSIEGLISELAINELAIIHNNIRCGIQSRLSDYEVLEGL